MQVEIKLTTIIRYVATRIGLIPNTMYLEEGELLAWEHQQDEIEDQLKTWVQEDCLNSASVPFWMREGIYLNSCIVDDNENGYVLDSKIDHSIKLTRKELKVAKIIAGKLDLTFTRRDRNLFRYEIQQGTELEIGKACHLIAQADEVLMSYLENGSLSSLDKQAILRERGYTS